MKSYADMLGPHPDLMRTGISGWGVGSGHLVFMKLVR